jgi:hypothetical protein
VPGRQPGKFALPLTVLALVDEASMGRRCFKVSWQLMLATFRSQRSTSRLAVSTSTLSPTVAKPAFNGALHRSVAAQNI